MTHEPCRRFGGATVHHTRAVIAVLQDAVSRGEIEDVRSQLPEESEPLFEAGSEGEMSRNR